MSVLKKIIKNKLIGIIISAIFINITCIANSPNKESETYSISGKVMSASTQKAISFSVVTLNNYSINTICNNEGYFEINNIPKGKHTIIIQSLGYIPKKEEIIVDKNITGLLYYLKRNSFKIEEINIMANKIKGDKVKVDESAIEYIQPISLEDVMLLVPGSTYSNKNITKFSKNTSRQAGSDNNSSLGVGYVADGAPISNDGMRSQMIGLTENTIDRRYDYEIKDRTGMNQGVDKRYISTDHIGSVEFNKGISSAKYGNISSGLIKLNSKKGVSPLRLRLKNDLKSTLVYIGKGTKLADDYGSLHLGVDFLNSVNDPREEYDKFSRVTGQAYYKNQTKISGKKLDVDIKISETFAVNKMKKDELADLYNESYKGDYSRTSLLLKTKLELNSKLINSIEFIQSAEYTFDKVTRHMLVVNSGPLSTPIAKQEGEHEGEYLPGMYYSDFYVENKPMYLFSQLNMNTRFNISKKINTNIDYGLEYKNSKNYGNGAIMKNYLRPPYPSDNSYMRPRPNYEIPAISIAAGYIQTKLLYSVNNDNIIKLSAGGRVTKMFNLSKNYKLSKRWIGEPRINLSYTSKFKDENLKLSLRIGYGHENKLPTMDYLYPEKIYKDFFVLNAYTNNIKYRHLIAYTKIFETNNYNLIENRNKKFEVGGDIELGKLIVSATIFYEKTTSGFSYSEYFTPVSYTRYSNRKTNEILNRRYEKTDYWAENYNVFPNMPKVTNNKYTKKRGIEYRVVFPMINKITTKIEINGAYYSTDYGSTDPVSYYPDVTISNKPYPYVGIYNTNPYNQFKKLNTNIWLNTHVSKFRLIFTNFFQILWINSEQFFDDKDPYPKYYFGANGKLIETNDAVKQKINDDNVYLRHLKRFITPLEYEIEKKPISVLWNIKATKEFGKYFKISFFADNIIDINPTYKGGNKKTRREWENPFFGFEIIFSL